MRYSSLVICVAALSTQFALSGVGYAADHCFPVVDLQRAYSVVLPKAKIEVFTGNRAQSYLDEFNRYPPVSNVTGDELLVIELPSGNGAIIAPIGAGIGCKRIVVSPRLHRTIMLRIGRDET